MRNKQDKSSIWDQEVLYKLIAYAKQFIKKYRVLYAVCRGVNSQGQLRAKSDETTSARTMQDIATLGLITAAQEEQSGH